MKKFRIIGFALLLVMALSSYSFAQRVDSGDGVVGDMAPEVEMRDLFSQWEMNGYPDYVGYVIYDNNLNKHVIGLVEGNQAGKDEILSQFSNPEGISFGSSKYSYNELLEVQNEISKDAQNKEGIYGVGVGWTTENGKVKGFGESGQEFRVVVTLDEAVYDEYASKYQAEYGDMVYLEKGSQAVPVEDSVGRGAEIGTMDAIEDKSNTGFYASIFVAMLALVSAGILINRRRTALVKQAANGEQVTESRPLTRGEVVSAVKESEIKPGDDLYDDILDKIKK
ncbi:MAG: hypothetical protein ACOXZT_01830 [Tissierellaceae bacterium]|jgi:hypothetical protein|nr:hypothetical protein [Tissierellia bacterium]